MATWRVEAVCRSQVCLEAAKLAEELLAAAESRGLEPPRELLLVEVEPSSLEGELEELAARVGAELGPVPESCVLYVGWLEPPRAIVNPAYCNPRRVASDSLRAAAHSLLHRGVEAYSIDVAALKSAEEVLGESRVAALAAHVAGAAARGYEATKLVADLGFASRAAGGAAEAARSAAASYASTHLPEGKPIKLLVSLELVRLVGDVEPYAKHSREAAEALSEILRAAEALKLRSIVERLVDVLRGDYDSTSSRASALLLEAIRLLDDCHLPS